MPYRGALVSLVEMMDVLLSHERTEAAAVLEIEQALEDKAILLKLPDGSDHDGEALFRALSDDEMSSVIALLRDFPNRMSIPSIRSWNAPIAMFKAARAVRMQFEIACDLVEQSIESEKTKTKGPAPGTVDRYGESDRARFPEIEALMRAGHSLTAAAEKLGESLEGPGTPVSKGARLRRLFRKVKAAN